MQQPWILFLTVSMSLRHLLRSGKGRSYGPFVLSDSPEVTEILAGVGYSHIVIDHEHSQTNVRSGTNLLRAIQASKQPTFPIVRVPSSDAVYMKKVLDTLPLPGGVLVPMVENAETARAVVRSTRYPKDGIRGCAAPFVRASGYGTVPDYVQQAQEDLLVMVQVETEVGVSHIPEIAAIDGVDGIFIGPYDLSASLGAMGDFESSDFRRVLSEAEQAVLAAEDCFLAGFRTPGKEISEMFGMGYSLVSGSIDLGLLKEAALRDARLGQSAMDED